jgi:NADH-quinone oxidoreductase subunit N
MDATAFDIRDLLPVAPEIALACGAMLLLMFGVFRGEQSARPVNWLSILILIAAGALIAWLPGERLEAFGGSFVVDSFGRFL